MSSPVRPEVDTLSTKPSGEYVTRRCSPFGPDGRSVLPELSEREPLERGPVVERQRLAHDLGLRSEGSQGDRLGEVERSDRLAKAQLVRDHVEAERRHRGDPLDDVALWFV